MALTLKVTVLMSVYNGANYLSQAIESILNQTFPDFEFLIFNDASTDGSREIINSYAVKDSRIVLINNERNIGLTKSLNRGLKIARGKYIARQDADDFSEPERLEAQLRFLDDYPNIGIVGTYANFVDAQGKKIAERKTAITNEIIKKDIMSGSPFVHGSVMFRHKIVDTIGFYREEFQYAQDYDYWLRVLEKYKGANIDRTFYNLRRGIRSISADNLTEQIEYHLLAIELAKMRQTCGRDCIDNIDFSNIGYVLMDQFNLERSFIQKFKSEYVMNYYRRAINGGGILEALKFWIQAFCFEPRKWKIRRLLIDLRHNSCRRKC